MNRHWGLFPADVKALIFKREWNNRGALKARLLNHKPFPIKIGLKPPAGEKAVRDLERFQKFIEEWRAFVPQKMVQWESRNYRMLSEQHVPKFFVVHNLSELIEYIGPRAAAASQKWTSNMSPLLSLRKGLENRLYPVLVKHLDTLESLPQEDSRLLAHLIRQLSPGMGTGLYLRALPLKGADTKFLESHFHLVEDIVDLLHDGEIKERGGLLGWLGCLENPKGWVTVRPLCEIAKAGLGGLPLLQISNEILFHNELPASNVLMVENMQSGLGLPFLENTVAVLGAGKNVRWMDAPWLKGKNTAYWGDMDTWGLSILSDVRSKLPGVKPLMMDEETLRLHEERMAHEKSPVKKTPEYLTEAEVELFLNLKNGYYKGTRLEQERLSSDFIVSELQKWLDFIPSTYKPLV